MDSCVGTLAGGLPHSDIHGSKPARGSPWLFAACHVLRRLLVPRHPPNALLMLVRLARKPEPDTPTPIPFGRSNRYSTLSIRHTTASWAPRTARADPRCPTIASDRSRPDRGTPCCEHGRSVRLTAKPREYGKPLGPILSRARRRTKTRFTLTKNNGRSEDRANGTDIPFREHRRPNFWLAATYPADNLEQPPIDGGDDRVRTDDPLLAKQVLSQLSYVPAAQRQSRCRDV